MTDPVDIDIRLLSRIGDPNVRLRVRVDDVWFMIPIAALPGETTRDAIRRYGKLLAEKARSAVDRPHEGDGG